MLYHRLENIYSLVQDFTTGLKYLLFGIRFLKERLATIEREENITYIPSFYKKKMTNGISHEKIIIRKTGTIKIL